MRTSILALSAVTFALAACADARGPAEPGTDASFGSAVKSSEHSAAIYWNGVARALVAKNGANAFVAIRGYALLGVAQYNAAIAGEKGKVGNVQPSVQAAISSASVAVLSYVFPAEATALEARLTEFLASPTRPEEQKADDPQGVTVGRTGTSRLSCQAAVGPYSDGMRVITLCD
jgi:hypothetical protein